MILDSMVLVLVLLWPGNRVGVGAQAHAELGIEGNAETRKTSKWMIREPGGAMCALAQAE
jgi:hypothetical protein